MDGYPITVEFGGITYKRNPDSERKSHRLYYAAPRRSGLPELHRAKWMAAHGPIPPGYHIHHIDGNALNNDLSNLACVSPQEHADLHDNPGPGPEHMVRIRRLAAEWHCSPEGIEWHKQHGRQTWEGRVAVPMDDPCPGCGGPIESFFPGREGQRFCSRKCIERVYRREHRYDSRIPCPICGAEFWQNKYTAKPATCSRVCGAQWRKRPKN